MENGKVYPVEFTKIDKKLGGGYIASIPELGSNAFRGYGRTKEEALANLGEVKKHLLGTYRARGITLVLPDKKK